MIYYINIIYHLYHLYKYKTNLLCYIMDKFFIMELSKIHPKTSKLISELNTKYLDKYKLNC